jgi:hypothetical protein
MIKTFRFYKDEMNWWFVDLPEWTGEKWELQMVSGADTLLDILSDNGNEITLTMSTESVLEYDGILKFQELGRIEGLEMGEGAWYSLFECDKRKEPLILWLCDVTKFVFGDFPNTIYIYIN